MNDYVVTMIIFGKCVRIQLLIKIRDHMKSFFKIYYRTVYCIVIVCATES